jgi:hypothetical protein
MGQVTTNGTAKQPKAKQPTKAELQRQLAEALARAEAAEMALLAQPVTATPPPEGNETQALLAPAQGVMRVWLMTDTEGYRLRLIHVGPDGCGWEMSKWSNGTGYHLHEADGGVITCDCPGGTAHGPQCNGGKGCKHARMLRAIRQVVDPGI